MIEVLYIPKMQKHGIFPAYFISKLLSFELSVWYVNERTTIGVEALSRSHSEANFKKIQRVLYMEIQVIQLYKTFDVVTKSSLQFSP